MLSIGEFSNICKVSTKTLRYYDEIGLLKPSEIDPENGYRYYAIEQLETMLFINRLKAYAFSLEEIKRILYAQTAKTDVVYRSLLKKKQKIEKQLLDTQKILNQMEDDMEMLKQGKSLLSYMDDIGIELVDVPGMYLLSVRKMVQMEDYPMAYHSCFSLLFRKIADGKLTMAAPPMVLFHSREFTIEGMDTEFALPVKEYAKGTRDFYPGLCIKTVVRGAYSQLPSVYAKQQEWAMKEGYQCRNALFEVYVTDPTQTAKEEDYITEVYFPVKKYATDRSNNRRKGELWNKR